MSEAATVFAIYRFRPDVVDATIAGLLARHRAALEKSGLVTGTLPMVVRSLENNAEHRDFIEIFEWKNATAPGAAHSDPGVRQIWDEFERLTTIPAVAMGQLVEAGRPFAHFAPFPVSYAKPSAAKAPKAAKAAKPKRAPAPPKKAAPKAKRSAAKPVKTHKPMAKPKPKARRKVGGRR